MVFKYPTDNSCPNTHTLPQRLPLDTSREVFSKRVLLGGAARGQNVLEETWWRGLLYDWVVSRRDGGRQAFHMSRVGWTGVGAEPEQVGIWLIRFREPAVCGVWHSGKLHPSNGGLPGGYEAASLLGTRPALLDGIPALPPSFSLLLFLFHRAVCGAAILMKNLINTER